MSRKVINITHAANKYDILSQTPKNYDKDNYFLKELQDKVNAEWAYRPNRVDVEFENNWGEQTWEPLEVVVQSVKSEKGEDISNDTRNLVFKDILEDRFDVGNRFRFSENYDLSASEAAKNVWLTTNLNKVNMTSSVVVTRCNGTIGSIWKNPDGTACYHYEPVIQGKSLTAVNFFYNETLISPQSQLLVIAQHNKYTKEYFINQRFIIGYDKVYRIKAINKFYSQSTTDPEDVGLIHIYMEITETSHYDDFEHRIAYQEEENNIVPVVEKGEYSIAFESPVTIPTFLDGTPITFKPVLKLDSTVVDSAQFTLTATLNEETVSDYVQIEENDGSFVVTKIRNYRKGNLLLTWTTTDPDQHEQSLTLEFALSQ